MQSPTRLPEIAPDISDYAQLLSRTLEGFDWTPVQLLADTLLSLWRTDGQVFLCGNGGSAANAIHIAKDFVYPIAKSDGRRMRAFALPANQAVLTCLGNATGYDQIFAGQLRVLARPGDVLLSLSGSGNSPNILRAMETATECGMKNYALVGFDGGKAKALADVAIHFPVNDMQLAEDAQAIVGHMVMKYLTRHGRIPFQS